MRSAGRKPVAKRKNELRKWKRRIRQQSLERDAELRMERLLGETLELRRLHLSHVRHPCNIWRLADVEKGEFSELSTGSLHTRQTNEFSVVLSALGDTEIHISESLHGSRERRFDIDRDLSLGVAMDIGSGDFNNESNRVNARGRLRTERPLLVIGSSRCVNFSQLQTLAVDSNRRRALARNGIQHLTLVCDLCRKKMDSSTCLTA